MGTAGRKWVLQPRLRAERSGAMVVSINPDWRDDFGHFGAWDRLVARNCRLRGADFVSLCHRDLLADCSFAMHTFSSTFPGSPTSAELAAFESELSNALRSLGIRGPTTACMYAGSVYSLAAINRLATQLPDVRFIVNLMRSHHLLNQSADAASAEQIRTLRMLLKTSRQLGVTATVDSVVLRDRIKSALGIGLDVWPMVATTPPAVLRPRRTSKGSPLTITAPTQPQLAKGFDLIGKLSAHLKPQVMQGSLRLVARYTTGLDNRIDTIAETIVANGGVLVEGNLNQARYGDMVTSANLIIVPYRLSTFETRTSAVVLDAATAAVPVLTTRGTWGGDVVDRHQIGQLFSDGDAAELAALVDDSVDRIGELSRAVRKSRRAVAAEFSPGRLVDYLTTRPRPAQPAPGDEAAAAASLTAVLEL